MRASCRPVVRTHRPRFCGASTPQGRLDPEMDRQVRDDLLPPCRPQAWAPRETEAGDRPGAVSSG